MQIGPPRLHVLRKLTVLFSSLDVTVRIDAFTLFPWSLIGLAVPDFIAWLKVSKSTHTHALLQIIITDMTK
jgi:hypothetical protein